MATTPTTKTTPARKPAAKAPQSLVVTFSFERDTKTTKRYSENSDEPIVGTLYLKNKAVAELGNPDAVRVTIEAL